MTAPLVRLDAVGKQFANGTQALAGLTLDIAPASFVSFLGPSGCGKSTALRLIAGLTAPTAGRIDWPGGGDPAADIGFVFQEPTLMPWASVFDNVYLPLRLRGQTRDQARAAVTAQLQRVGLQAFAKAYPRELSGGMKMRVSLARALVTAPRILLLDEPFAALDEITRFALNDDLARIAAADALTVLFVTHSVYESVYLSDRVVVFSARPGRVIADLQVSAPRPRTTAFRADPAYVHWCLQASQALQQAHLAHV
jgi:NitT/TauT family transport system ATP-binding protein